MSSPAFNNLDWCLKKAKKEIEECKINQKKIRHRGLLKITPDKKLAFGHLQKAMHNLEVFKLLRKNQFSDWAVTAGFYIIYHCFLAIALKYGYESKNQTCTVALQRILMIVSNLVQNSLSGEFCFNVLILTELSIIETLQEQGEISIKKEVIDFMKYKEEESYEDSIIELREDYTYGVEVEVKNQEQLDRIEKLCIEFTDITKEIIYK